MKPEDFNGPKEEADRLLDETCTLMWNRSCTIGADSTCHADCVHFEPGEVKRTYITFDSAGDYPRDGDDYYIVTPCCKLWK